MSKVTLLLSDDGKRICAGHLTARGNALKPGMTDVTDEVLLLAAQLVRRRGRKYEMNDNREFEVTDPATNLKHRLIALKETS